MPYFRIDVRDARYDELKFSFVMPAEDEFQADQIAMSAYSDHPEFDGVTNVTPVDDPYER